MEFQCLRCRTQKVVHLSWLSEIRSVPITSLPTTNLKIASTTAKYTKSPTNTLLISYTPTHATAIMATTNGANGATEDVVEKYDNLPKMIQYLDRHLVFPLLDDREDDIAGKKLRFELLKGTNMFDFLGNLDAEIRGLKDKAPEYAQKREETVKKKEQFEEDTEKLRGLLEDEAVVSNFRSDKVANLKYLETDHAVTAEMVNQLYEYGNFQYSCGDYQAAGDLLYQYRVLVG